jgi:hypothetical protein
MGPLTRAYGPPVYFKELAISLRQGVMVKILCPDDLPATLFPNQNNTFSIVAFLFLESASRLS